MLDVNTDKLQQTENYKRQTRPLVREGAPQRQELSENNLWAESNIWSQVSEWARYLDILTDTVSYNVNSTSTYLTKSFRFTIFSTSTYGIVYRQP
jgi:hypothetical protein